MRTFVLATLIVWLTPTVSSATVLVDWSLEELVRRSDLIVIGTVDDQRVQRLDGHTMTVTDVLVQSTLVGEPCGQISVWQHGGEYAGILTESVGEVRLAIGQRVLLFTRAIAGGRRAIVGMSLGAWLLSGTRARQVVDVPVLRDGLLSPAPGVRVRAMQEVLSIIERGSR